MKIELSEYMAQKGVMRNWAERVVARKTDRNIELSEEELEISEAVNEFSKNIAMSGVGDVALSQFLVKVIEPEITDVPSEIISRLFTEGDMAEFDDLGIVASAKNTLVARESAARTGNVDKSYIDFTRGTKMSKHLQLETEIKMSDLRRDGALSIAELTLFALDAFELAKFKIIMNHIDSLVQSGGAAYFECAGALTQEGVDGFAGYIEDYGNNGVMVGLTTTLRGIKNMPGYDKFMTEGMKEKLYSASIIDKYNGVDIVTFNAAKKLGDGSLVLPEKKIYGIADKIGMANMRGALRVLQTPDNNREVISLKFTGYEFVYAITDVEKICKLVIK